MDYLTKPTSREVLRELAILFRQVFGLSKTEKFPVLAILDKMSSFFPDVSYAIVEDSELPKNIPARCLLNKDGSFLIEISQTVYEGAYEREVGGYRSHILHEICHVLLYKIGFTPIVERSFNNNEVAAYCSVEWQAKALCGELMMPHNATKHLSIEKIMDKYGVSYEAAVQRKRYN